MNFFSSTVLKLFDEEIGENALIKKRGDIFINPGFWSIYIKNINGSIDLSFISHIRIETSVKDIYKQCVNKDDEIKDGDIIFDNHCTIEVNNYHMFVYVFKLISNQNTRDCFDILKDFKDEGYLD